jgi:hypothetical protein
LTKIKSSHILSKAVEVFAIVETQEHGPLVRFRALLGSIGDEGLWNFCFDNGAIGRAYSKRGKESHSSMPGSQITLSDGLVWVVIYSEDGKDKAPLHYRVFGSHDCSDLEERIVILAKDAGISLTKIAPGK